MMGLNRALVLCAAFASLVAGSCKGKTELTDKERDQLAECTKSISAITDSDGEMRMVFLAEVCGASLGFPEILEAGASMKMKLLAEKTDYLCNKKVAKAVSEAAPERRTALLVEACGAEYYGLTKSNAHHLSMSWFMGQRSAAWIADTMSRAGDRDKQLVAALTMAMSKFEAPLPIPAQVPALYELPQALSPDMVDAMHYLLVDEKSTKLVERAALRLTPSGAVLVDPLADAKTADLSEIRKQLRGKNPNPPENPEDELGQAIEEEEDESGTGMKMADIEGKMGKKESTRPLNGSYSFKSPRPDPEVARQLALDHARKAGVLGMLSGPRTTGVSKPESWAPLLIADKAMLARRVLAVVDGIRESGVNMGVAYPNGALQTMVPFGRTTSDGDPLPDLRAQLLLRDDAIELWVKGQKHELARSSAGPYPYDVLTEKLQAEGDHAGTAILISAIGDKATYWELVAVLDVAQKVGLELAVTGPSGGKLVPKFEPGVPPTLAEGELSTEGDLDKEIIRRYIRRKFPRIRHCYEKELMRKPTLAGTVTTSFQISPRGSVEGAAAEGLGNKHFQRCIVAALQSIQFPKPKGKGSVDVRYPFTFRPTG